MVGVLFSSVLFLCLHRTSAYIETVFVSGCESCKLHLTCRHFTSIIAILEADFTPQFNDTTIVSTAFPPFHPRQALNQRCSGVNHCSFILTEDCPGANTWGLGKLTVTYVCISEDRIRTFCNSEILLADPNQNSGISEGFIHNPGYPRFYSSEKECRWKIKAHAQQKIKITVLDIAVTADSTPFPHQCTDHLEIFDSGQIVASICQPQEPPLQIISDTDFMEVVLASSHTLIPQRGVLMHYTAIGCPTPLPPQDGYLVYRNDTAAEFRCCVGFAFPDDGARTRIIQCLGAFWDTALPFPNCRKEALLPVQEVKKSTNKSMASDILAPAILIAALFLINFIVLLYIYKIRQKHAIEYADEELGTLSDIDKTSSSP